MNWREVYFGHINKTEVRQYIVDREWQRVRLWMKGKILIQKFQALKMWLEKNNFNRASQVQCTNYVTALSRGGLIKTSEYR